MIKIVNLKNTLNPITAAERVKINENWDELRRAFSQIQLQINFLAGGTEVNEIIERIEDAIRMAETGSQQAIDRVNESLSDLNVALNNLQTLTTETNAAKDNAISATNDARNAIREISDFMNEFRSLGAYNSTTEYKRNNMASLNGNTYIALSDNVGVPTTNTNVWALFARRGFDGDRGPQGEAGASLNVRGSLPNESALPSTGVAGDAYTINGDLYVWSIETNGWVNVGQIKGEKGDKGEAGESGFYQLANFQYVINATSNGQNTLEIPLQSFDPNNHSLLLFRNTTAQSNDLYSISGRTITLNEPVSDYTTTSFYLFITQGVLIQPQETINASFLMDNTVQKSKLSNDLRTEINNSTSHINKIASTSQLGHVMVDGTTIIINGQGKISSPSSNNNYVLAYATKDTSTSIASSNNSSYLRFDSITTNDFVEIDENRILRFTRSGTYLVSAQLSFSSNATGTRTLVAYAGSSKSYYSASRAMDGSNTYLNLSYIYKTTGAERLDISASQNSGTALDITIGTFVKVIRLGD